MDPPFRFAIRGQILSGNNMHLAAMPQRRRNPFAHESQAKMKSATRVVTGSSPQTSHAGGMETPSTCRDLCRGRAIFNSLDLNLPLNSFR